MRIEFEQILSDDINDLAGAARPDEIRLFGPDLEVLEAYGKSVAPKLSAVAGIEDFFDGVSEPSAEMAMQIDAAEANRVGLTPEQVADAASGALLGVGAGDVRLEDRVVGVRVRAPDSVRFDALQLRALPVVSAQSHVATPLGALASFHSGDVRSELLRENQQQ